MDVSNDMEEDEIVIDEQFIKEYQSKYDNTEIGGDEPQYHEIIKMVSNDVSNGTISPLTFIRILDWKWKGVCGKIEWEKFDNYRMVIERAIEKIRENPDTYLEEVLKELDDLPGIGIPVASTILHFIFPKEIPIVDIRTVEALRILGYLDKDKSVYYYKNNIKGYKSFRCKMLNIAKKFARGDIRKVDRAMFAFHYDLNTK